jgi:type I restriction enzyme M protein
MTAKENIVSVVWKLLSLTRGILPPSYAASSLLLFMVIRRLECLYEPYRMKVLSIYDRDKNQLDEYDMDKKIRKALGRDLDYYILTNSTMRDLLAHGYFQGTAGLEHYIRCFDRNTAEQLIKFGALDYANRLLYAKSFAEVINEVGKLSLDATITREEFDEVVSWLLQLSYSDGKVNAESYSTSELSKIMATALLADKKEEKLTTIYDPVCGSGNLLRVVQSQYQHPVSVYGQDISERMTSLNGLLAKTSNIRDCYFVPGDVLEVDGFPERQFDYVVADLPFRMRIDNHLLWNDNRFPMGMPSNSDATGLFIQHIVSKMALKGKAVFTCAPLFLFEEHPYSDRLRSWLLKQDVIECIIALPSGFISGTTLKTCLCVLNKNKSKQRKGTVQIINAESLFPRQRMRGILLTDRAIEMLLSIYHSFENNSYCRIANNDDFFQSEVQIKQPKRKEDGSIAIIDGKMVADREKTISVTIPKGENNLEDYIYRNVITHLDKDSWIDQTSVRVKCKIDIYAPFEKVLECPSLADIENNVSKLSKGITALFANLFNEKQNDRLYIPEETHPLRAVVGSVSQITRSRTPLDRIGRKSKYPILTPDYLRGYISEPNEFVESLASDQIVAEGDVLILMDGENAGEVFYGKQGCMTKTLVKVELTTDAFDKDYFYYQLKAKEPELRQRARGEAIKHLTSSDLRSISLIVPSKTQQVSVVRYLKPKTKALDELIPMLGGKARETLISYRQALISEAINPKSCF